MEFALVATLLITLLLGVIVFGILLSKRQVLTQATAEGARAAVPYRYTPGDTFHLRDAAKTQVNKSLEAVDKSCDDGITQCTFVVYKCGHPTSVAPNGTGVDCFEVSVVLQVKGSKPLVPSVSPVGAFLPSTLSSKFTASLANPT